MLSTRDKASNASNGVTLILTAQKLQIMLLIAIIAVSFSAVRAAPTTGACLCLTTSGVNVRDAAGLSSHVIASVSSGECYKFNGGILTKEGHTWYEIQNVHGHHRAWVASDFLRVSASSSCGGGSSSGSGSGTHSFATGLVSAQCLQCICQQESGCRPIGCHWDVNSNSCGYFQIKNNYYEDCHHPGSSWQSCADDIHCATSCIQKYMERYAAHYGCPMTCQSFAREHNGGPRGCHSSATLRYWQSVKSHPGCHNLV